MARVVLENVSKCFRLSGREETRAVSNLSIEVHDGECLALVGPSGSGKSTLLRLIAGLESVTSGLVSIGGRVVNDVPPEDRNVAMVFQNYALYPHMTAFENMAFPLRLRRVPRAEMERRVRDIAETLGVSGSLDRRPAELSGGQRQRVALGRALLRSPEALLLDEPLSNLDARMRIQMRLEIARLHKRLAVTLIYVTHDQGEAMALGDRIAVLDGGVVQQVARPLDLYRRPANLFVAGFIGSPPMNCFRGTVRPDHGRALLVESRAADSAGPAGHFGLDDTGLPAGGVRVPEGRLVVLGLRPEHVRLERLAGGEGGGGSRGEGIEVSIELVERLGAETHVHFATAHHRGVVRCQGDTVFEMEERAWLRPDLGHAHWFDAVSGLRIEV